MNLLETLLQSQNGRTVGAIAEQFGLDETTAKNVIGQLLPAVSRALQRNAQSESGLDSLLGALEKGNHQQYLEQPQTLTEAATVDDGNAILGHLFGSKEVSRNVAQHAANQTGVDSGILKKMLPLIAAAAMGALSKTAGGGGPGATLGRGGQRSATMDLLSTFLDADKDGSIADDLLNLAKKFF